MTDDLRFVHGDEELMDYLYRRDIYGTYGLGVNSFIVKPVSFESPIEIMKILAKYCSTW